MRVLVYDVAVLEGAWLRFVTVADQVNRLGVVWRYETPFHASGESCSTSASEPSGLHLVGNGLRLHGERFFQLLIASILDVAIDGIIPTNAVDILKN